MATTTKNISVKMTRNGYKGYIGTTQEGQFEYSQWEAMQWMAEHLEKDVCVVAKSSVFTAEQVAAHTAELMNDSSLERKA